MTGSANAWRRAGAAAACCLAGVLWLAGPLVGSASAGAAETSAAVRDAGEADAVTAFVGARLIPIDGPEIPVGVLVVEGGEIVAVGTRREVRIPDGAEVIDVSGKVIMPGLVCSHSHVGGIGGADGSGPIQPEVRIADSINVRNPGFKRAVAGGLTTLNIMPGSGHLMSGQTIYVKLRGGDVIDDLFILDADGEAMGGLKMANGTNPMRDPPWPGTRGKTAALVRQRFLDARAYAEKRRAAEEDPDLAPPARDLALEPLVEAMNGERMVHHHTHRHDDIMTVLRLADEFGFRVVLHHVSEAHRVAEQIAESGAMVSAIILDSPGGKLEAVELVMETPGILERAGVHTALHTDDWITDSRLFLRMAAMAVRAGMTREGALRAVTLANAEILDLGDRIGSLTPGKEADFVILSGDPLSIYTRVVETYVEGERVFDLDDETDRLYADGGFGAGQQTKPYLCCYDHAAGHHAHNHQTGAQQ